MSQIIRKRKPGEPKIKHNGEPKIHSKGKIGAIVKYPMLVDKGEGYGEMTFEKFSRPPGTRTIAIKDEKIFLQKERRFELDSFDWRLPGGKVFDSFEEYEPYINKSVPEKDIIAGAKSELKEESEMEAEEWQVIEKKVCGSTVDWDLYYLTAENITENIDIEHTEAEEITERKWFSFEQVEEMCREGEIQEGRSVAVLLNFFRK
ncbi:MAG: NUDIX domain-containing protein [Candidatus Magasanikbacteria bacterium]